MDMVVDILDCAQRLGFDIGHGREHKDGRTLVEGLVWGPVG